MPDRQRIPEARALVGKCLWQKLTGPNRTGWRCGLLPNHGQTGSYCKPEVPFGEMAGSRRFNSGLPLHAALLIAATAAEYTVQYFLASSTSEPWTTPPNSTLTAG